MAINPYTKGSVLGLTSRFTSAAGLLTDPGSVLARVLKPSGLKTEMAVAKDSTGIYHLELPLTESGKWVVRIESADPGAAAVEREYFVRQSAFD